MDTLTSTSAKIPLLKNNWHEWAPRAQAAITKGAAWEIVTGNWVAPTQPSSITAEYRIELRDFNKHNGYALGVIQESISPANLRLINGKNAKDAWKVLKDHHNATGGNLHYQYLQELANVHQKPKESLTDYIGRIQLGGDRLIGSIPSTTPLPDFIDLIVAMYALQNLQDTAENDQLEALIKLKPVTLTDVVSKFEQEDTDRATKALGGKGEAARAAREKRSLPRLTNPVNAGTILVCLHCTKAHQSSDCWKKFPDKKPAHLKKQDEARAAKRKQEEKKKEAAAKTVEDDSDSDFEVANMASLRPTHSPASDADLNWNTDTGATSSMTPHRSWIRDMVPCQIPVHVANDEVVMALGRGSVLFRPVIDGVKAPSVVFSRVLYVPSLSNNLLAVLPMV